MNEKMDKWMNERGTKHLSAKLTEWLTDKLIDWSWLSDKLIWLTDSLTYYDWIDDMPTKSLPDWLTGKQAELGIKQKEHKLREILIQTKDLIHIYSCCEV